MKYTKHPIKTKYLYKSETNGSVYAIITKSSKGYKGKLSKKLKLFDDINNRDLWSPKMSLTKIQREQHEKQLTRNKFK